MDSNMIENHQNKYVEWKNRQQVLVPRRRSAGSSGYEYESWEERAFAEDAARGLGGFIWPPRSYTCSFCRREFKSAQALGGHMNVHRRDRARLKQALSPRSNETIPHDHHQQNADSVQQTTTTIEPTEDSPNDDFGYHARGKPIVIFESAQDKKHVSTKLCMGDGVVAANNKCKRLKSGNFILVDPCLVVQSSMTQLLHHEAAHLDGVKKRLREELDLELRLGV